MKQSENYSEKDFGKRSDTSSHYRIKSRGFTVQLMATMGGDKPAVKNEFLICQTGFRHEFIVASLNGYNTVKLFTLKNFIKYEYEERNIPAVTIPFEQYINPDTFLAIVAQHFFHLTPKKQSV